MRKRLFTLQQKLRIKEDYDKNRNLSLTAKKYGVRCTTIAEILRELGVIIKPHGHYICNESYFENIDTEDKAYWLGFISADGNITFNQSSVYFKLTLNTLDKTHLEKLKQSLSATYPIRDYNTPKFIWDRPKIYNESILQIGSEKLCSDLMSHGISSGKKTESLIPWIEKPGLVKHWWRGLIDGDGSVGYYTYLDKRWNKSYGYWRLSLSGNKTVMDGFNKYSAEYLKNAEHKSTQTSEHGWITQFMAEPAVKLIRHFYENSTIYLSRKYNTILPLLNGTI